MPSHVDCFEKSYNRCASQVRARVRMTCLLVKQFLSKWCIALFWARLHWLAVWSDIMSMRLVSFWRMSLITVTLVRWHGPVWFCRVGGRGVLTHQSWSCRLRRDFRSGCSNGRLHRSGHGVDYLQCWVAIASRIRLQMRVTRLNWSGEFAMTWQEVVHRATESGHKMV